MKFKLPEGWKSVKLEDYIDVKGGKRLPKCSSLITNRTEHAYIRIRDMYQHKFLEIDSKIEYIDESTFSKISQYTVNYNDVILAIVGNTIGLVSLIGKSLNKANLTENCVKLIGLEDCLPEYIYYYLTSDLGQIEINRNIVGTSQPKLPIYGVKNINLILPRIEEQKVIADTLSALDDKIENNNKIIENLEQQALAIFKHWFVDFEFSNEEGKPYKPNGGEMVESELGLIPKGWNIDKLGKNKLGNLVRSGIKEFSGEKIYLATADVADSYIVNEEVKITIEERPSRANMQPKPNTVWFAKMKDSRKLILVDELDYELQNNYIFSTGFAGLQASKDSVYYLWTYLQSKNFDIIKNSLCTGTTMQSINNSNINRIKIVIPPNEILSSYNQIVRPMFRKIVNNLYENRTLAKLRDTLLPKLMSGEIRIPLD